MNSRFNGTALRQLPDGFWRRALADLPATVNAFQATAPPSAAQALQWLLSAQAANASRLLLPQMVVLAGQLAYA